MSMRNFYVPRLLALFARQCDEAAYAAALGYFERGESGRLFMELAQPLPPEDHPVLFALLAWAEVETIPFVTHGAKRAAESRARKLSEKVTGVRV